MTLEINPQGPGFFDKMRRTQEFLWLDGVWYEQDRGEDHQYLDINKFAPKKSLFVASMNSLLSHSHVDPIIVKPHFQQELLVGKSKRAVLGLQIQVDKLDHKRSLGEVGKIGNFIANNLTLARRDFEGYTYDQQAIYGDSVNFVDFLLAMRLI